jgi:endonuclease I
VHRQCTAGRGSDLHNLMPALGELYGGRSNKPYGMVTGALRLYGSCDFEIVGRKRSRSRAMTCEATRRRSGST